MNYTPATIFKIISLCIGGLFLLILIGDVGEPICTLSETLMDIDDVIGVFLIMALIWVIGYFSKEN